MKKFLFYFLLVFSLSILSAFKAYSQPPTVTHEVIAYTMAMTVIDNFNMIDTKSDATTTTVQMYGKYLTEETAKILIIQQIVRRYSDISIVFPWSYYQGYLATILHIDNMENYEIIILIKEDNYGCELYISVIDKTHKI